MGFDVLFYFWHCLTVHDAYLTRLFTIFDSAINWSNLIKFMDVLIIIIDNDYELKA